MRSDTGSPRRAAPGDECDEVLNLMPLLHPAERGGRCGECGGASDEVLGLAGGADIGRTIRSTVGCRLKRLVRVRVRVEVRVRASGLGLGSRSHGSEKQWHTRRTEVSPTTSLRHAMSRPRTQRASTTGYPTSVARPSEFRTVRWTVYQRETACNVCNQICTPQITRHRKDSSLKT